MKISKHGKVIALSLVGGLSLISLAACGAEGKHPTPATDSQAQNVQNVEYEGMSSGGSVIIFDVMRPDGTVLTCSTKKDSTSGASCFEKKQ